MGLGQNVGLRYFCHSLTLLQRGASVFHKIVFTKLDICLSQTSELPRNRILLHLMLRWVMLAILGLLLYLLRHLYIDSSHYMTFVSFIWTGNFCVLGDQGRTLSGHSWQCRYFWKKGYNTLHEVLWHFESRQQKWNIRADVLVRMCAE